MTNDALAVDAAGNSYVVGVFRDTMAVGSDELVSPNQWAIYIAKYDPTGAQVWAKDVIWGDTTQNVVAEGITVDGSGAVSIVGRFAGGALFGARTSISRGVAGPEYDLFVAHFDSTGTFLWKQVLGSTGFDDAGGISFDFAGNVYVAGEFHFSSFNGSAARIIVAKYTPSGTLAWIDSTKDFGNGTFSLGIRTDLAGNSYIIGSFFNTLTFDSVRILDAGNRESNMYIGKIANDGRLLWLQSAGSGGGYTIGRSLDIDALGNCFVTGFFHGTISLGTFSLNGPSNTASEILVAECDDNGAFVWAKKISGIARPFGICSDGGSGCYLAGSSTNAVTMDSLTLPTTNASSIFLTHLNERGHFSSALLVDAPSTTHPSGIAANASGVYLTGSFVKQIGFGPSIGLVGDTAKYEGFLAKLTGTLGVKNDRQEFVDMHVWPNPSHDGHVTISNDDELADVCIYDLLGRCIYRTATTQRELSTSVLLPGSYRVVTTDRNGSASATFVVTR